MAVSDDYRAKNTGFSKFGDKLFRSIAISMAIIILLIMAGILLKLIDDSELSLKKFGLGFLTSQEWNPVTGEFGALSSIFGSVVSTIIALIIAVPLSLVIALFLVELAPPIISKPVGSAIELLAAIPSIIYGMWGLFVFAPYMADHVQPFLNETLGFLPLFQGPPIGIGMLTAGIILALMILPFVSAVMRDVFQMVPSVVKESAYGMGSTTWEVTKKVTIRYGIKGMIGACFLGLGRAIGETMAVTFVIGNVHYISNSLFSPSNTIASTLANEFAEASEPLYLHSLIELGLVLFIMTLIIQVIAQLWISRLQKSMGGGL
jgi:phosphate transport system permease protein